jgi:cell division protein FtsB
MKLFQLIFVVLIFAVVGFGVKTWLDRQAVTQQENANEKLVKEKEGFLTTRKDFNDKLEDIKQRREEVVTQIGRLDERKKAAAEKLKGMGVATAGDLEKNDLAQLEFANIKRLIADVEKFKKDLVVYDSAIGRIEVALADLDRQELLKNAGISDEQAKQLNTIIHDIDDRLMDKDSPLEQLQNQDILDDLFGK